MIKIAPSILSADFRNLEKQLHLVEEGGADWVHLDVMDGHFVPNITFGPMVAKAVSSLTSLPVDAHLMIEEPDKYIEAFAKSGVSLITVHVETCHHLHRTVELIHQHGVKAGVTLNPSTPIETLDEILPYVDLILIMTVNPGFSGQQFIPSMLEKIQKAAVRIGQIDRAIELQVDGGVDESNAGLLVSLGATVLVAGHAIFSKRSIPAAIRNLRKAAKTRR
jgi:ribulose-phosphate 3-epimerase